MLGMFINTLAMRGKPEGKKTYLEFLSEMKETCLKAYELSFSVTHRNPNADTVPELDESH